MITQSKERESRIRRATKAGQSAKTGFLAVTRITYITVLLGAAVVLLVGIGSLFTWSDFWDNLRLSMNIVQGAPTAVVGLVAASVAVDSLRQKRNADDRDAALARLQWAMDLTTSELERERNLGWNLLSGLVLTPGLLAEDTGLAKSIQDYVNDEKSRAETPDDPEEASD